MNMIDHFLIATIYTALIVMLLSASTLFAFHKSGDRSRIILGVIISFSVVNYIPRLIKAMDGIFQGPVLSVPMLSLALFMILSYTIYPIEVISPGWTNRKRLLMLYTPVILILSFYGLTLLFGVEYKEYSSIIEMLPHFHDFNVAFRLFICFILCLPIFLIFYIPYTRKFNNTDRTWMIVYVISGIIDVMTYLLILSYHTKIISIIYFHFTMAITALRLYMELIYRIVDKNVTNEEIMLASRDEKNEMLHNIIKDENENYHKESNLFIRLERYMIDNQAWRNPNLSLSMLTEEMGTNRTSLTNEIHKYGIESITAYINNYRISDFIFLLNKYNEMSIKEAFYICGYRSRTTAIRNFRTITGKTPTEYFGRNIMNLE